MKTFKLVIAGGGSTYTPGIVKSLLVQKDRFKLNELVLYDNNAERQEAVGVIVRHVVEMFDPELKLTLTTDPEVAMTDADFIFAQMRVGLYAMREQDEKIPLKYGVVGQETCGPGGLATHNIAGLMESLDNHKVTDQKEKQTILRLSDYGRKGTQVWKLLSNTAWSKIGAPGKYIIAALASGRK